MIFRDMELRNLKSVNLSEITKKTVLIRVDYNLPSIIVKGKAILDDFKIRMSLPTIKYLLKHKSKIVLISHFKDPWKELKKRDLSDIKLLKQEFSLKQVIPYLEKTLDKKVKFIDDCLGGKVINEIKKTDFGEVILLENLRFYQEEEKNNPKFTFSLSQLASFYINNAFAVSHRKHASVDIAGLPKYLPSAAGFLLIKEVKALSSIISATTKSLPLRGVALRDRKRRRLRKRGNNKVLAESKVLIKDNIHGSLIVVLGGAKIETKIDLIKKFLKICDYLLVGGMLANEILRAKKMMIGKPSVEIDSLILSSENVVLPVDMAVLDNSQYKIKKLKQVQETDLVLDIGPKSQALFKQKILSAKTIFWNGPLGMIEKPEFSKATKEIALAIAESNSFSIIGGGETSSFIIQNNLEDKFNHISTGGGAMLFFLSNIGR